MKKVLTIGEILVEIMAVEPGQGFREAITLVGPFASGAPAIFIDQAARFGQPCAIIGSVGKDDFGAVCVERLRRDGVDVGAIAEDPERPTGSAFVRYRPDGARDFVFNIRHSACGRIEMTEAAAEMIRSADHLHVMGTSLYAPSVVETVLSALRSIKAKGGTVSFDPNLRPEILNGAGMRDALRAVIAEADVFLPSGNELFLFTEATTTDAAVGELLAGGIKAIVLKQGAAGATYYDAEKTLTIPGFPVDEVDPTGAGDCFGAAFVTFWLEGADPQVALRYANAAGALAVTRTGPMEGASTRAELQSFLEAKGRKP
jgi:sugar/nucleoside kinase (ribokinase family)